MPRPIRPPRPAARKPRFAPPPLACDTHAHIYGPFDRFPLLAPPEERSYTPTDVCTLDHYLEMHRTLGLERAVIVTGNPNGRHNNAVTCDAIRRMGGRFKGLAYLDAGIEQKELQRLAECGFTGYRIRRGRSRGSFETDAKHIANRVREFGWHVEVHIQSLDEAVELLPWLPTLGLPYVLDHVAHAEPGHERGDPRFDNVLDALKHEERCWLNIYSFYLQSKIGGPDYADMLPIIGRLVEARPDRLLWGSNWPHAIAIDEETPDDGDLLDFLYAAVPDPVLRRMILVDNPARLYGWQDESRDVR
ncbi:MAG TPA: amidohydrolase family protein [Alphaproteobacteria bacterium]|nr:amidohydrolase family protein [Alphaproteobacteria bacterium]